MIGIYVHTHWAYNHPYAARTWTVEDWAEYLSCLKTLGYDTVLIWPQHETMPAPPTSSDRAFLDKLRQVIDIGQNQFGLRMLIGTTPNIAANEKATQYKFEDRYFWDTCRYVDPRDRNAVAEMLRARAAQWEPLARADGMTIIDSDPGGWPNSPSEDFVELFRLQGELMLKLNSQAIIYYWMWGGWPENMHQQTYLDTLSLMKEQVRWPWQILSCSEAHRKTTDRLGLANRRAYYPYGLVELEPSFPMTNANAAWFRQEIQRYDPRLYPQGVMFNAQTHCLQIPRTYLAAHYARGGTIATEELMALGEELIPGTGGMLIGFAWLHLEEERDFPVMRHYSKAIREQAGKSHKPGPLAGLIMMPPEQFLLDLADNLDIRADFIELRLTVDAGRDVKKALRNLLAHLRPYRDRVGYNHTFQGPLYKGLTDQLLCLDEPALTAALRPAKTPSKGYLINLLDEVTTYANS